MKENADTPYEALERIFHEPNRLSIMATLCASRRGMAFGELKEHCGLTDGNLNRHLKALEKAGAIRIDKSFVGARPRTTVSLSSAGLERFSEYLEALSDVLEKAKQALPARKKAELPIGARQAARA